MEGGAWQSDVFDNGQDCHKKRPPVQGASPEMEGGKKPALYNPSSGKEPRAFGILVVLLRTVLLLVSLAAFSVTAANRKSEYNLHHDSTYFKSSVTFFHAHAFVGLLSMDVIVCAYAIVQVVVSLVKVSTTGAFMSSPTRSGNMITFVCDLVLSYALMAAAAAAADTRKLLDDAEACRVGRADLSCPKATAFIVVSFVAFAVLALLTALYPIRLLRMSK